MKRLMLVLCVAACDRGTSTPPKPTSSHNGSAIGPTRPHPPPLRPDMRPIDLREFEIELNPHTAEGMTIHADENGGCHTLLPTKKTDGSYPGDTPVPCPPPMLAPEWGYCTGTDSLVMNDKHECVCIPGSGDPLPPLVRVPCPNITGPGR